MGDGRTEVLYLAPWIDLGGSDKGTIDWFAGLDRTRFAPSLITTQRSPNRWVHRVEPHAEEVWVLPDVMAGDDMPEFILGFVESRGVEVVHVMNSRLGIDLLPDLATLPRPPATVVQLHAEEPGHGGYVSYAAARYAALVDCFSVTSDHLAATLRERYDVAPQRIEVIRTGVDARGEFDPTAVQPIDGIGSAAPAILWPGRLVEQKDPLLTLEVAQRLRARGVAFELHMVGDGWLRDEVHRRAGELQLGDVVRFHPPTQEIARWLAAADVTLMTSAYEGVPYVIYESLAMGVPVVAPALAGNAEVMDADGGVLVDPRDGADAYAEALEGLLADAQRRASLGERSRARMLASFGVETMCREHEALYDRLIAARARAPAAAPADRRAPDPLRLPRDPAPERSVAVVVPCFGHGRHLDACIGSVRAQTMPAAQIVVVDDASPDDETRAALAQLEEDGDVTVVRLDANGGPSVARNRGLERVTSAYVLFLDADDLLLPEAIETLLGCLETAADDVAFAYPNALHFGNRHDYERKPDWNLYLLTFENVCPVTSLFDARVFDDGIRFAEDLREGHEDWDLILQLAARGARGVRAPGPTFLYRQGGFSRVDAQHLARRAYGDELRTRHPALFDRVEEIKASWAPAVSLIMLGGGSVAQGTTRDVELLEADDAQSLAVALAAARGTFVAVLAPQARPLVERRAGVEQIVRILQATPAPGFGVLAGVAGTPHRLAVLGDEEGELVALAWRRTGAAGASRPADLGVGASLLWDLAWAFEEREPLQWRALGAAA